MSPRSQTSLPIEEDASSSSGALTMVAPRAPISVPEIALAPSTALQLVLTAHVLLALSVIWRFELESANFPRMAAVFVGGALVSWWLPVKYRQAALTCSGVFGAFALFPPIQAMSIIAVFLVAIAIAVSSVRLRWKVFGLFALTFGVLAVDRSRRLIGPQAVLSSVFGAVFMFRMIAFLKDTRTNPALRTWKGALAYFFILPNLLMTVFPVIDFKGFARNFTVGLNQNVIRRGIDWMFSGTIQLILYRLVENSLFIRLNEATTPGEFVHYIVTNYLLYLRISGTFHLAMGMLTLYGFDLPLTHNHYLFSSSFTDYWRRINIYWKDFMVKVLYYPSFFLFRKKAGHVPSLILATLVVFVGTWALHDFQYFWNRGRLQPGGSDLIFWGTLAICVAINTYLDYRALRRPKKAPSLLETLSVALKITGMLVFISLIWALWSIPVPADFFAILLLLKWKGTGDLGWFLFFPAVGLAGALVHRWQHSSKEATVGDGQVGPVRDIAQAGVLCLLLLLTTSTVASFLPSSMRSTFDLLRTNGYENRQSRYRKVDGFYEGLRPVGSKEIKSRWFSDVVDKTFSTLPEHWSVPVSDYRGYDWTPNTSYSELGEKFETNRWGMHDRDYPLEKPQGVIRVALVGSSISGTWGIPPGGEWPKVVESRLQKAGAQIEIMNFAVTGYSFLVFPYVLDKKVFQFHPDLILVEGQGAAFWRTGYQLTRALRNAMEIPYPDLLSVLEVPDLNSFVARHYYVNPPDEITAKVVDWSLGKMTAIADGHRVPIALAMLPFPSEALASSPSEKKLRGTADLLNMAREHHMDIIDASKSLDSHPAESVLLENDVHYNVLGNELVGADLAQKLADYLKKGKIGAPKESGKRE